MAKHELHDPNFDEGVDALFSDIPTETAAGRLIEVDKIIPGKMQYRGYFDEDFINGLAETFKEKGFKGAINVRPAPNGTYEIVAGEQRWLAAQRAKLDKIKCLVDEYTDEEALEFGLLENAKRRDTSKLETLEGILKLLQFRHQKPVGEEDSRQWVIDHLFADGHPDRRRTGSTSDAWKTTEQTLNELSISIDTILSWLRLLKIPDPIRQAHLNGKLDYTKAIEIAKLKEEQLWQPLLKEAITKKLSKSKVIERVKSLKAQKNTVNNNGNLLVARIAAVQKRTRKATCWDDQKAVNQVEQKLAELEELLRSLNA